MNDSADFDMGQLAGLIFLILIFCGLYLFVMYPQMRGPAADVEVNTVVNPSGLLSEYQVTFQFVDDMSYSQFLSYLYSQKFATMNDYVTRSIADKQSILIQNDSSSRTIRITAKQPFDPNNVTTTIRLNKYPDSWEFIDNSIVNSSYLPEKYLNKFTYNLAVPTDLINANTFENSSSWWMDGKQLTWHIDRNKNPLNPSGDNIASQTIYAKFKVPDQNTIPRIYFIIIGGIVILGLIVIIMRRR